MARALGTPTLVALSLFMMGANGEAAIPRDARPVIAALAYANTWMLAPFPRIPARRGVPAQRECRIPAGGPGGARSSVPGTCATYVTSGRRFVTVAFVETWSTSDFSSQGATTPTESHTWLFTETPRFRVLEEATYGDVPPQWVR
jgi:hypothetical protein